MPGPTGGSNDTSRLGRPATLEVDEATNELYVAESHRLARQRDLAAQHRQRRHRDRVAEASVGAVVDAAVPADLVLVGAGMKKPYIQGFVAIGFWQENFVDVFF